MYACNECGEKFRRPAERRYTERVEYWGFKTMEVFTEQVCPECGSENYRRALPKDHEEEEE